MKLAMILLVHDEADILEDHLKYHLNAGVDVILAIDDRSKDGTRELLESYVSGGWVSILPRPSGLFGTHSAAWRTALARSASVEHGADWILTGDPDEFWWPLAGDLKSVLEWVPAHYGQVMAPCSDFVFTRELRESALKEMTVREVRSPLAVKVAFRGSPDVVLDRAAHRVELDPHREYLRRFDSARAIEVPPVPLLRIFHYAVRSAERLQAKRRATGGDARRRDVLWRHGRAAGAVADASDPEAAWRREALERGLRDGRLVVDDRLARLGARLEDPRREGFRAAAISRELQGRRWDEARDVLGEEALTIQDLLNVAMQRRDGKLRARAQRSIEKERKVAAHAPGRRIRALFRAAKE